MPVKAFMYQNHEAHIQTHMSAMQDPLLQQMVGQNPMAAQIQAAMTAHISEHLGFAYRSRIEEALGVELPPPDEPLPPEVEVQLSRMIAQAAPMVLQESQNQVAMQQAQAAQEQAMNDPVLQIQQQEVEIRAQEVQRKAQKDMADVQLEQQRLALEAEKMQAELMLKGLTASSKIAEGKRKIESTEEIEGVKLGMQMAQHKNGKGETK